MNTFKRIPRRILTSFVLVLGLLPVIAFIATHSTRAEPNAPLAGGTFTVNANTDNTTSDNALTLREALLLARGGTGASGLNRALNANEQPLVAGCVISGGLITGGCGAGITDTIIFNLGIPVSITLGTSSLPLVDDSAPTIIDGGIASPTIDASAVTGSHRGLHISSNNNMIKNIGIANTSLSDFYIAGDSNLLSNVWAWDAGTYGIYLASANANTIDSAYVGVSATSPPPDCGENKGNAADGIFVNAGASNVITGSVVGCNGGNGITLDNGTSNNSVIANRVGVTGGGFSDPIPNSGDGLLLQGDSHDNIIGSASYAFDGSNDFIYNILDGVMISGTNTATNTLFSNYTASNNQNGIRITQGAHNNILQQGGQTLFISTLNLQNGTLIAAGAHNNTIQTGVSFSNSRNGIELSGVGTSENVIQYGSYNTNARDGINERNGADNNTWSQITTHDNGGLGIDKNAPSDTTDNITPPFPIITGVSCGGGSCTVSGTASIPFLSTTIVEVFAAAPDPSGYGEGKTFLNSVSTDGFGKWTTSVSSSSGTCFTAFQTQTGLGTNSSSEFGPNSCRAFLPIIMRP